MADTARRLLPGRALESFSPDLTECTMKKLKLELDTLRVDSFAPAPEPEKPGGTVAGHAATPTCPTHPLTQCPWSAFPTCGIWC